ncbi:helix-turn-helix transcriptional regulator, partial [Methylobacterium fujisawaense]
LDLPDGGSRFVIVAGQPIAMGDEPCMLFTFADLELRRKAETALRQSEERFAKAFRMTPVPTVLVRADTFQVTGINEAFSRVFGHG